MSLIRGISGQERTKGQKVSLPSHHLHTTLCGVSLDHTSLSPFCVTSVFRKGEDSAIFTPFRTDHTSLRSPYATSVIRKGEDSAIFNPFRTDHTSLRSPYVTSVIRKGEDFPESTPFRKEEDV